jgi:hypothetical protein
MTCVSIVLNRNNINMINDSEKVVMLIKILILI